MIIFIFISVILIYSSCSYSSLSNNDDVTIDISTITTITINTLNTARNCIFDIYTNDNDKICLFQQYTLNDYENSIPIVVPSSSSYHVSHQWSIPDTQGNYHYYQ